MDRFSKITNILSAHGLALHYALTLLVMSIAFGKSIKIDVITPKSIYPCLDTFNLLITTPNISDDHYIRLIRVYTSNFSNKHYADIEKLDYVREYKLPLNNLLKFDCHFFVPKFHNYCFVFVALSRKTGAVLINGKPHCRPTTIEYMMTSTQPIIDYNLMNSSQLRPAGPSYKYNPTKSVNTNIFGNSRRVMNGNTFSDNYFENSDNENIAQFITISCKCSDNHEIISNMSTIVLSIDIIKCNNNKGYERKDSNKDLYKKKKKMLRSSRAGNYGITSTICILNLSQTDYKMKVKQLERSPFTMIYVPTHIQGLIVREGRLAIDPQLDINNKSQTHLLKSQYLRIESYYSENITLKLVLLKSNIAKNEALHSILASLTPIHYTSIILIIIIIVSIFLFTIMSVSTNKRRTIVRIITPSEEGDQTHTSFSYMDQTSLSKFSLDDNQSLEMDYYDYLLPFVPRPNSAISDLN